MSYVISFCRVPANVYIPRPMTAKIMEPMKQRDIIPVLTNEEIEMMTIGSPAPSLVVGLISDSETFRKIRSATFAPSLETYYANTPPWFQFFDCGVSKVGASWRIKDLDKHRESFTELKNQIEEKGLHERFDRFGYKIEHLLKNMEAWLERYGDEAVVVINF